MTKQQKEFLCQSIKSNRERLNLSQEKLAEELNYTKQTISNWDSLLDRQKYFALHQLRIRSCTSKVKAS